MRGIPLGFILAAFLLASLLSAPGVASLAVAVGDGTAGGAGIEATLEASASDGEAVGAVLASFGGDVLLPHDTHGPDGRLRSRDGLDAPEPGTLDTSRFMMGSVAVAIILPESDGTIDTELENWTAAEIATADTGVRAGVDWWTTQEPNASLSISYDPLSPYVITTSYEPISRSSADDDLWVSEVMGKLGYTSGSYINRVRAFDNALRTSLGTDWAFTVFVVDDSNDTDHKFTNGRFAFAYLGGPFQVLTYENDGWGIANMDRVAAHETGHIFWATDEYDQGPTPALDPGFDDETSGYLNVQEIWLSECIMDDNTFCVSAGTAGQIGWVDTDGDGVFDILDVAPETTLTPHTPNPTNDVTPTYTGSATVVAFPSLDGRGDVTINTIAAVEYQVDSLGWSAAMATDLTFDEAVEAFTFTLPLQAEGSHTIEARAQVIVPIPAPATIYDASPGSDTLEVDVTGAESEVNTLPTWTRGAVFTIGVTTVEGPSTIDKVELFSRKDGGAYSSYETDSTSPFSFSFATAGVGVGDGLYEFYSLAYDTAGNVETAPGSPDASTTVDTVAPVSLVEPLGLYTVTSSFMVTATASDPNGILSVELFYRRDGGTWTSYGVDTTSPYAWSFDTLTASGDGLYEFYSIALDFPTNDESQPLDPDASTVVDTGLPDSASHLVPAYTTTSVFTVTAAASDAGTGVAQVELFYRMDSGPWTSYTVDTAFPWSWSFDTATTGGDGSYAFHSLASDTAGNVETAPATPDTSTIVDTVAPTSSVGALAAFVETTSFIVAATAVDADAVASVELFFQKDGGAWTSYAVDEAFPWSWSFDTAQTSGDGSYAFHSIATDAAANGEAQPPSADASTIVDTGPPTSVPDASPFTNATSFVVVATATDAGSGVAQVELFYRKDGASWNSYGVDTTSPYVWNLDAAPLGGDGVYEFYTVATDVLGKVESAPAAAEASTAVDTVAPVSSPAFSGTTTTGVWYASIVRVTLSATDATSGVSTTMFRLDGGPWQDFTEPFDVADEGLHTLEFASTDAAGNAEDVRSVEFGVDLTPPALAITAPGSGAFLLEPMVRISWSVSDATSGLESCSVAVDGGVPVSAGTATSQPLEDLRDGPHQVVVSCTDVAGQVAEEAVAFTYLTTDLLRVTPLGGSWIQLLIGLIVLLVIIIAVVRWRRRRRKRST